MDTVLCVSLELVKKVKDCFLGNYVKREIRRIVVRDKRKRLQMTLPGLALLLGSTSPRYLYSTDSDVLFLTQSHQLNA